MARHEKRPIEERLWAKVSIPADVITGCWPFMGARHNYGHGKLGAGERGNGTVLAHRVAWEFFNGPIPPGLIVRHLVCNNPPCCNPAHLALGTFRDNTQDAVRSGRFATGARHGSKVHPESVPCGKQHHWSKLTESKVMEMRDLFKSGVKTADIAKAYGVSEATAHRTVRGESWKHLPN